MSPLVIQMHGLPGSGKSTVAQAVAPHLGAVALDKDVIQAALLRAGVPEEQAGPSAYEVYFAQAGERLVLDTMRPLDELVDEAMAHIRAKSPRFVTGAVYG